jgi:hypothetical protein
MYKKILQEIKKNEQSNTSKFDNWVSPSFENEKTYSEEELVQILKEFAIKKSYEYKEKYPDISEEELNKNFGKLLRNGVALLGLVHAHRYMTEPSMPQNINPPEAITRQTSNLGSKLSESVKNWEDTPKTDRSRKGSFLQNQTSAPSFDEEEEDDSEEFENSPSLEKEGKINNFLNTTAMIESSGGKNLKHPKIKSGIHRGDSAIGQWALMPKTVQEIAGRMSSTPEIAAYAKMDKKKIANSLAKNPHHEKAMVSFLANKLYDKFGGDENKMAYAWNQGHNINPESFDTNRKDYLNHDYVQKYNKYKTQDAPARSIAGSKDK